jgi:hypothetical protein
MLPVIVPPARGSLAAILVVFVPIAVLSAAVIIAPEPADDTLEWTVTDPVAAVVFVPIAVLSAAEIITPEPADDTSE